MIERMLLMSKRKIISWIAFILCMTMTMPFAACHHATSDEYPSTEETTESETETSGETTGVETTKREDQSIVTDKPEVDSDNMLQVSESGNIASVTTASDLSYTATGYSKYKNGVFTINKGYTVSFDDRFSASFNRLTLEYVSDAPLKCTVTYVQNGESVNDLFYLEAGLQSFSALTLGYLSGEQSSDLTAITFSTCEGENTSFALYDVNTEVYDVYADDVYYIENDSYILGIRLSWGGGVCYLKDLKNTVDGIDNLINQADTGRLVQQSYYGTYANGEYINGDYNGTAWPYNPVQGGDVYGNPSRIIDVVEGERSLYIKAQPQDWGHNGDLTLSYMENTYILEDDYIRVDNRFVDFSGWEHRYANQELPAFYTLSYFNEFSYYAGSNPWTDQALTSRDDLKFWGDERYHNDCVFNMRYSNTETWCAWTNGTTDYGVGLYVPNVDILLAGRFSYNGSKDSENSATNYVAPLNTMKIVSFEPIEYSYMMTTGSLEQIRGTFKDNKDFATNESLHINYISERIDDEGAVIPMNSLVFDNINASFKLQALNNTRITFSEEQKAAMLTVSAPSDPFVNIDYTKSAVALTAEDYSKIVITYMIPKSNIYKSYSTELFLCTGSVMSAYGGKSVRGQLIADGEYHTLEISVAGLEFWSGNINAIRFDYFETCAIGDVIYVKSIELK